MATGSGSATAEISAGVYSSDDRGGLLARLRLICGMPSKDDTERSTNAMLLGHLRNGFEELADLLQYPKDTRAYDLEPGVREYDLDADLVEIVFAMWNGIYLEPSSVFAWQRDGTDWFGAAAAPTLSEYSWEKRTLLLYPPPNAAAIATAGQMTIRAMTNAPAVDAEGAPQLQDADVRLGLMIAAEEWCSVHPDIEGNVARGQFWRAKIDRAIITAKQRTMRRIAQYSGALRPHVYRRGTAR
jgi:hypothetical protein